MMATDIDQSLIPSVLREAIDQEVLKRAQSIVWSISRDTGDNEYGYLDDIGNQKLGKDDRSSPQFNNKKKNIDWQDVSRCDSGIGTPPTDNQLSAMVDSIELSGSCIQLDAKSSTKRVGEMKKHPLSVDCDEGKPFPIYQVNQNQLDNDAVFEVCRKGSPGQRRIHSESSSRNANEEQILTELGLDSDFFPPNSTSTLNERFEESVVTSEINADPNIIENLYNQMQTDTNGYFDYDDKAKNKFALVTSGEKLSQFESVEDLSGDEELIDENANKVEQYVVERIKCTILLKQPVHEVKVEPKPIVVETKEPLKQHNDKDNMLENPNSLWLHIDDAQYGPPFGTKGKRKGPEEEWIGPPCELCHKQIEEKRCMLAENRKFHCWHFSCSFCLKVLKPADFLISKMDKKPYCLNCHKRWFPEISLVSLKLEEHDNK